MPQHYPVDPIKRFSKFNGNTAPPSLLKDGRNCKWPEEGGLPHRQANLLCLEEIHEPQPQAGSDFDPLTHRAVRLDPVDDFVAETTTYGWVIEELSDIEKTAKARETQREELRVSWDALDPYLRGPYRPLFDSANKLLDEGDDEAAVEMIDSAEPTAKIAGDPTMQATFDAVKATFKEAIEALPS